jgi:hypothetical protein
MGRVKQTSVINLIYSGQQLFSYIMLNEKFDYAEFHSSKCLSGYCHSTEHRSTECHLTECHQPYLLRGRYE